jgi:hypothetical protein
MRLLKNPPKQQTAETDIALSPAEGSPAEPPEDHKAKPTPGVRLGLGAEHLSGPRAEKWGKGRVRGGAALGPSWH